MGCSGCNNRAENALRALRIEITKGLQPGDRVVKRQDTSNIIIVATSQVTGQIVNINGTNYYAIDIIKLADET